MSGREYGVFLYGVGPDRLFMKVPADNQEEAADAVTAWLNQHQWQDLDTAEGLTRIRTAFVSRIEVKR